jgi:hypothetical protein
VSAIRVVVEPTAEAGGSIVTSSHGQSAWVFPFSSDKTESLDSTDYLEKLWASSKPDSGVPTNGILSDRLKTM